MYIPVKMKTIAAAMCIAGLASSAFAADDARYIVKFKEGKGKAAEAMAHQMGGKKALGLDRQGAFAAHLPKSALESLKKSPWVEYVEEDVKRYPMAQSTPYGISMVQADVLSDGVAGNRTVCIIDSGYDISHPDLAANLVTGSNDPSGAGNWYEDQNHHGTHVAGTIAALNNNEGVVGIMPNGNIKLHIVKVFGADGWAYSSSLIAAVNECEAHGANVINMSLGGSVKSRTEETGFKNSYARGVLNIAAAGNDGNTRHSYPASYSSVISVAAIDEHKVVADFSQKTSQVELSGPGVGVLSSVPDQSGTESALSTGQTQWSSLGMDGSPLGSAAGALADCGTGASACTSAAGKICLIQRGTNSFAEKVQACEAGGGAGAVIYNNVAGPLSGTMGDVVTSIPSVGISDTDGAALLALIGSNAAMSVAASDYAVYDGTSMATPHVVGVAALVWSYHSMCTNDQIRSALRATAEDLGVAGRDDSYGYGLVRAKTAKEYLDQYGCAGAGGGTGGTCKGGPKQCG